jgi:serine/threonine protein kinase
MFARDPHDEVTSRIDAPASCTRPTRVGSCDVHAELASGGTASVFIGVHHGAEGFQKVVAIKRLLPAFALDRDYQAMLADEAAVSARADHPYVRDVFDFGFAEDGTPYAIMEFLFGQPLSSVCRTLSRQTDLDRDRRHTAIVARIIANLCEGLHAVHELSDDTEPLDIVHRDITPHNLFVLYDGTVRVTDFGIVRARVRRQAPSGAVLKGKVPYMSPEYLSREPYDRRSDVWAMGVVLWELLTGSRLFRKGSDPDTVCSILTMPVPPPSNLASDVDRRLDAIALKALARNVDDRYRSARELANDLEEWLSRESRSLTSSEIGAWLERMLPGSRAAMSQLVRETRAFGRTECRSMPAAARQSLRATPRKRPSTPPFRPSQSPRSASRPVMPVVTNDDMTAFALSRPRSSESSGSITAADTVPARRGGLGR